MRSLAAAGAAGALFGAGLLLAGMTRPEKVVGFLDVFGRWDPSLLFVMAAAVSIHAVARPLVLRRTATLLGGAFQASVDRAVDARLLAGAGMFGAGWGLGGLCPGPAIVSAAAGGSSALAFVSAMLVGAWIFTRRSGSRTPASPCR